jgi:AraC-like DNA-binding protein
MSDRVRQLIVLLLPLGHCRVEVVAQHLGVDRRTVARHLAAEGLTFREMVDALRGDLVVRYLAERSRPLSDVSALLGFAAPSAFARWHRQRFGFAASRLLQRPPARAR